MLYTYISLAYIRDKKEDNIRFSWKFPSPSSQIAHKLSASRETERERDRKKEIERSRAERGRGIFRGYKN